MDRALGFAGLTSAPRRQQCDRVAQLATLSLSAYASRTGRWLYGTATTSPSRSSWRSRAVRTLGAIPVEPFGHLAEALRPVEQACHDLQCPAITDHGKCVGEVASIDSDRSYYLQVT